MHDEELALAPATELLELISTKQVSPVELTELYFVRIDRLDSRLNSYLLLTRDEAVREAKATELAVVRGDDLGALHGLPVAIKDTQMTKGIRTTSGSLVFKDRVPQKDAAVVGRVRAAGAIILGKTNVPEFGFVGSCENKLGDPGRNPWNTDRTPGGSSGGAAAGGGGLPVSSSSPSEDYLTVLAGQRQWIATTNFAGCPGRPPDSFANSAVLTTSAKVPDALGWPIGPCFPCAD